MVRINFLLLIAVCLFMAQIVKASSMNDRTSYLIEKMPDSELKRTLASCKNKAIISTPFSIGHRGAPLFYPEHTKESYIAAASMGAGALECDVTFTKDKQLVCRHAQCDLHTTTDILLKPQLAEKCSIPFSPGDRASHQKAQVMCCTSDLTLNEFKQLRGKVDDADEFANTPLGYTKLYSANEKPHKVRFGQLMTHQESIKLFSSLNVNMVPELKVPEVSMPFNGLNRERYGQQFINDYIDANINPMRLFPQSFHLEDIINWRKYSPKYSQQAVYLDGRYEQGNSEIENTQAFLPLFKTLEEHNVKYLAPPLWMFVKPNSQKLTPSNYIKVAKSMGFDLIAWTLERSGTMENGGGWYYQTANHLVNNEGFTFQFLDFLVNGVGVKAVFSDWPETISYYENCIVDKNVPIRP